MRLCSRMMLFQVVACVLQVMVVSVACSQDAPAQAGDERELPRGYREIGPDKVEAIRELCQATADTGLFSGAVLVAVDGEVLYQEAFGLANREWDVPNALDTKFRLASVSKQFCSMLALQLVQEGKLTLEDPITKHLKYFRSDTGDRITIHHLLSHQSGIKDLTSSPDYQRVTSKLPFDQDEFIKLHCSGDLEHEPGTIYSYCNAGYIILGRIIEKVTHKSYEQNLNERIFQPLGMTNSGVDRNHRVLQHRADGYTYGPFAIENADYIDMDSSPGPSGNVYSTVGDMYLWDRALHTDALLNAELRKKMFTPNRSVPEVKAAGGRSQSIYGYGWQIVTRRHPVTQRRTKVVKHGGAIHGFRAMECRLVDDNAFVIVLCNLGDPMGGNAVWNTVVNLSNQLTDAVVDQPFRMPSRPRPTQEQRMYQIVKEQGVEAAVEWFNENGKPARWGGSYQAVAKQLLKEQYVEEGLRLMTLDVEAAPSKVWLIRQAARASLENGRYEQAAKFIEMGQKIRPDDERFESMRREVETSRGSGLESK